jgi:hypothetical protein
MFSFFRNVKESVQDTYLELKDSIVAQQEASDDLITAPTPEDRVYKQGVGWPKTPAAMPGNVIPAGYKVASWDPPEDLTPRVEEAPYLFDMRRERPEIGR